MDRYKKTSLKFDKNLGYGRNLRAVEINSSRAVARNSRFSMQRCLEEEVENSENKPQTKIATLGKQTLKAPMSRLEMLQKWKEEKQMKRKQELQNKKPTFKIGVSLPKSIPVSTTGNKTDSKICSMKDSRKISSNVTSSRIMKETCPKPPSTNKFQALPLSSMKTSKSKEPQIHSFNIKPTTQFSNSKLQKESHVQVPNKPKTGLQKPLFVPSKPIKKEEVHQASMKSQLLPNKSVTANKPIIAKSKIQPLSSLPKSTDTKILKKPEQVQPSMPRRIPNRIPEPKSNQMQNSGRIIKGPSKTATQIKPTGIPNKSGIKPKLERKTTKKTEEASDSNITFQCEISHIEPVEEQKSFAPKDFVFNPGANLSFSFLEEGPLAIYAKLKAGEERTSTPKRKELLEIQEKEAEKCRAENKLLAEQVSDILEIQDAINTSCKQTSSCFELSEGKEPNGIAASPSEAVKIHLLENDVCKIVLKESDVSKSIESCEISCGGAMKSSPEDNTVKENPKLENITNIPEVLSALKESPIPSLVPGSVSSDEQRENIPEVFISPEDPKLETFEKNENGNTEVLDNFKIEIDLESPITQESVNILEDKKFVFEENEKLLMAGPSNELVKPKKATLFDSDAGIISRRRSAARCSNISIRGNRRSEMPLLESISESLENSPQPESPPKPLRAKKSALMKDFTPRRSLRLARRSEFDSSENLFNVRPSLCDSPPDNAGSSSACNTSNITYDFDKLHLEASTEQPAIPPRRMSSRKGNKVSLLYTPPQKGRASSLRKSIKGDLMSFSPDV